MKKSVKKIIRIVSLFLCSIVFVAGVVYHFDEKRKVLKFADYIERYADTYGLDEKIVKAVIKVESDFNENALSKKGAAGLMQLTPSTFEYCEKLLSSSLEVEGKEKLVKRDIFDPNDNIAAGCAYLRYLYDKFGTELEVLCAYNAGEGTVKGWLGDKNYSADGKTLAEVPYKETYDFAKKVIFLTRVY